ncbi:MAG: SIMPL domain-containing protein [Marinifilaceae bacterium]|nr:SIMPL domain-containing protein [Marinifilaceae bacterium]
MKSWIKEAAIIAIGLCMLGLSINSAIRAFVNKERVVSVKGLAEMEVEANKVTWPIAFKEVGNDVQQLYKSINEKSKVVVAFLKENGIADSEISVNPAEVVDMDAERYSNNNNQYRYISTSVITVTSTNVKLVRKLISEQTALLQKGVVVTGSDYRYNVNYEFTGLNDIKPGMIEEATKNARAAAEKFAKDSDSKLGKIKRANQGQFSIYDRDINTPYIKTVRVVTSIDYYLNN